MDHRALVTGFAPYGGRSTNAAHAVMRALDGAVVDGLAVVGRPLPVAFRSLRGIIGELLAETVPTVVISLGLWPGEPVVRLERYGLNLADFEIPDNEGTLLEDATLADNGPLALKSTLPLATIERELLDHGIPARISGSAGAFLCNAALYAALSLLAEQHRRTLCGFIHLPYLPEQVAEIICKGRQSRVLELHQRADLASMDLEVQVRAVRIALCVCARAIATATTAEP